jgi:hypothetical protein
VDPLTASATATSTKETKSAVMIAFMSSSRSAMEEVDRSAAKKKGGPSPPFLICSSAARGFDLRFDVIYRRTPGNRCSGIIQIYTGRVIVRIIRLRPRQPPSLRQWRYQSHESRAHASKLWRTKPRSALPFWRQASEICFAGLAIDRVAIRSDFDRQIPAAIKDATGLPNLIAVLQGAMTTQYERLPSTIGCAYFDSLWGQ